MVLFSRQTAQKLKRKMHRRRIDFAWMRIDRAGIESKLGLLGRLEGARFTKSGHFLPKKRVARNSKTASPMPPDQRKKVEDYTHRITPQGLLRP
jgi:hypothetical protein